jgi:tetratricopeptide (TPR) repeat protein
MCNIVGPAVRFLRWFASVGALFVSFAGAAGFEELAARAAAARDANQLPEAVKLYRQALELNPKWQEGWWSLGTILYDTNEYAACRAALGRLVELRTEAAPAWAILGLCEFQTAAYESSLAHLERSLELKPAVPAELERAVRYHEAILLTRAGSYDRAIRKFTWFLQGTPPGNVLLPAIGLAALRTSLLPQDIPAAQQDLYSTAGLAAWSQMTGDHAGAERNFKILLELYPTAHHVHYLYACSLLAASPEEAIREFRKELEITPSSSGTLSMLAWALMNRGDARAASTYAESAVRGDPTDPLAQYVLGRSLVETGDVQRGISHLELAVKGDPDNLENHLALAAAYPKAHRYEEARRERRRSLELTGDLAPNAAR